MNCKSRHCTDAAADDDRPEAFSRHSFPSRIFTRLRIPLIDKPAFCKAQIGCTISVLPGLQNMLPIREISIFYVSSAENEK
jgi:hypothetical protein